MKNGKRKSSTPFCFKNTPFSHSRYMLRSVVLCGCFSMALTVPVFAQSAQGTQPVKTAAAPLKAQQAPEKTRQLFAQLKQQALYDPTTKASYVFSKPLQDEYLDALMQKENIYYADSHSLVVQIDDESTLATFQKAGFDHKKIADGVIVFL